MPVPARNLNCDFLRFKLGSQQASGHGIKQHGESTYQVDGVSASEDIKQRAAGVGSQKGSLCAKNVPYQNLTHKKTEAQKNRYSQPWQIALQMWRNDAHGGELLFFCHRAARQLKGSAAEQQDHGIRP